MTAVIVTADVSVCGRVGIDPAGRYCAAINGPASQYRVVRLIRSFIRNRLVDMTTAGVINEHQVVQEPNALMSQRVQPPTQSTLSRGPHSWQMDSENLVMRPAR